MKELLMFAMLSYLSSPKTSVSQVSGGLVQAVHTEDKRSYVCSSVSSLMG